MFNFRTPVSIPTSNFQLNHNDSILSLGSCFSDNIAKKFKDYKFNVLTNPFGVLYNPISISNSLNRIISGEQYTEDQIKSYNSINFSLDHYSSFNSIIKSEILNNINTSLKNSHKHWKKVSTLIITFGTSYVYELKSNNSIVANCHRLPASEFNRRLLSPNQIINEYSQLFSMIQNINPNVKVILTISPVRHLRDSAHENQISKAHLFTAVNEICKLNNSFYYFPSYEIMMDELRDYRFYADDMIHPSKIAENYIFDKFINSVFNSESISFINDYEPILKSKRHKIMTNNPEDIKKFQSSILKKISALNLNYPHINLKDDLNHFNQLH